MHVPLWRLIAASLAYCALDLGLAVFGNQSVSLGIAVAFYAGLPVLLLWFAIFAWSVVLSMNSRRNDVIALLCPIVPILGFVASVWAMPYVQFPQDYVHFRAMRASYEAAVARLPGDGHRFEEFNWGGLTFASKGVVYDETDGVALPYGHQSADWKRRMSSTDLTCGGDGPVGEVMPIGEHYYIVTFGC